MHDSRMGSPDRGAGTIERPGQDCVCLVLPTLTGYSEFCTWIESKQTQRWKYLFPVFFWKCIYGKAHLKKIIKKKKPCNYFSIWPSVLRINHIEFKLITSFGKKKERQESGIAGNSQGEMVRWWLQDNLALSSLGKENIQNWGNLYVPFYTWWFQKISIKYRIELN